MDITVYLPDDLGEKAKAEGVNLSRTLRDALIDEFQRRDAMKATLDNPETLEIELMDEAGNHYTGRITGTLIGSNERHSVEVYLTDDERVIFYDGNKQQHQVIDEWHVEAVLRESLDDAEYAGAMFALGRDPVVDI